MVNIVRAPLTLSPAGPQTASYKALSGVTRQQRIVAQAVNFNGLLAKENNVKKLMIFSLVIALVMSAVAVAQDNMKQDSMKSDTSIKATSVTGKISDDGKTFVNDKDGKSWTISNPDAVKGHEGHHVTLKAHIYADKNEVHVMSLKMAPDNMKKDNMQK